MDVNQTQSCAFPHTCFWCRAAGHIVRECPVASDVWHTDVLDEVVHQLGDNLLDKLFACLAATALLLAESIDEDGDPVGFPSPAE
jgi:hypothetical protein